MTVTIITLVREPREYTQAEYFQMYDKAIAKQNAREFALKDHQQVVMQQKAENRRRIEGQDSRNYIQGLIDQRDRRMNPTKYLSDEEAKRQKTRLMERIKNGKRRLSDEGRKMVAKDKEYVARGLVWNGWKWTKPAGAQKRAGKQTRK